MCILFVRFCFICSVIVYSVLCLVCISLYCIYLSLLFLLFFFFKQKTAYEMRISDWSSDVCSSDLEIAAELGLSVALKPDSQDICFVPDGDYAKIVRKLRPDADEGGDIVHIDGRQIGRAHV